MKGDDRALPEEGYRVTDDCPDCGHPISAMSDIALQEAALDHIDYETANGLFTEDEILRRHPRARRQADADARRGWKRED